MNRCIGKRPCLAPFRVKYRAWDTPSLGTEKKQEQHQPAANFERVWVAPCACCRLVLSALFVPWLLITHMPIQELVCVACRWRRKTTASKPRQAPFKQRFTPTLFWPRLVLTRHAHASTLTGHHHLSGHEIGRPTLRLHMHLNVPWVGAWLGRCCCCCACDL